MQIQAEAEAEASNSKETVSNVCVCVCGCCRRTNSTYVGGGNGGRRFQNVKTPEGTLWLLITLTCSISHLSLSWGCMRSATPFSQLAHSLPFSGMVGCFFFINCESTRSLGCPPSLSFRIIPPPFCAALTYVMVVLDCRSQGFSTTGNLFQIPSCLLVSIARFNVLTFLSRHHLYQNLHIPILRKMVRSAIPSKGLSVLRGWIPFSAEDLMV